MANPPHHAEVGSMLVKAGAILRNGHFVFTSERHSDKYVNKDALYPDTAVVSRLGELIAQRFQNQRIEVVIGPAIGAVSLSQWTAHHLALLDNRPIKSVYAEWDDQPLGTSERMQIFIGGKEYVLPAGAQIFVRHPRFVIKRGYDKIVKGKKVLLVGDVITNGGTTAQVVQAIRDAYGKVAAVAVICNRGEVTRYQAGDVPELFSLFNLKLEDWTEDEMPDWLRERPVNTEVGHGKAYLARQNASG